MQEFTNVIKNQIQTILQRSKGTLVSLALSISLDLYVKSNQVTFASIYFQFNDFLKMIEICFQNAFVVTK